MPKKAEKKETTEQISEETVVKDVALKKSSKNPLKNLKNLKRSQKNISKNL